MSAALSLLTAPRAPRAVVLRPSVPSTAPPDLALVAVAAADCWASGAGLPPPRPYLAGRLLAACTRAGARHHLYVRAEQHARAGSVLTAIADGVNAAPEPLRRAVLCAVLLDLLNDRAEPAFARVSDELARIDREVRAEGADGIAAEIAEKVRERWVG